jgi:hypothetical protein
MKMALIGLLTLVVSTFLVVGTQSGEKKEVTLKGTILCAKCALKEKDIKKCTTAIQVKEGDKTLTYYFDDKGHDEKYHDAICESAGKAGTVVGTVTEKGGKKWIRPTKVEYAK